MDFKKAPAIIILLILLGMVVGVGVITLDKFRTSVRELTTVTNESFTVPAINGSITLAKGENATALTTILNSNGSIYGSGNYTFSAVDGTVTFLTNTTPCQTAETDCVATYTYYEYQTDSGTAAGSGRDAVADVSNTWMALIVTIIVLAIIVGMVIVGFAGRKR